MSSALQRVVLSTKATPCITRTVKHTQFLLASSFLATLIASTPNIYNCASCLCPSANCATALTAHTHTHTHTHSAKLNINCNSLLVSVVTCQHALQPVILTLKCDISGSHSGITEDVTSSRLLNRQRSFDKSNCPHLHVQPIQGHGVTSQKNDIF
jgi:hypothetical protein